MIYVAVAVLFLALGMQYRVLQVRAFRSTRNQLCREIGKLRSERDSAKQDRYMFQDMLAQAQKTNFSKEYNALHIEHADLRLKYLQAMDYVAALSPPASDAAGEA